MNDPSSMEVQRTQPKSYWMMALQGISLLLFGGAMLVVSMSSYWKNQIISRLEEQIQNDEIEETCLEAFGRRITETQNIFLTDGIGELWIQIYDNRDKPEAEQDEILDRAIDVVKRTVNASQAAVEARKNWINAGKPQPCVVDG